MGCDLQADRIECNSANDMTKGSLPVALSGLVRRQSFHSEELRKTPPMHLSVRLFPFQTKNVCSGREQPKYWLLTFDQCTFRI